jgi:hypothetical protein
MDLQRNRVGGGILVLAGLLSAAGGYLHGPQPGTLSAYGSLNGAGWHTSHVAIGLAGVLFAAASVFLNRLFTGTAGETWSLAGAVTLLLAGFTLFLVGALETTGFQSLTRIGDAAVAESAFQAVSASMAALATAAGPLFAATVLLFGLAMLAAKESPSWIGWSGAVLGAVTLAMGVAGLSLSGLPADVVYYAQNVWWVLLGTHLYRAGEARVPGPVIREPAAI